MKKSELKELIRTSLLEEMEYTSPSTYTYKNHNEWYNKLHSIKEEKEEDIEVKDEVEVTTDETEGLDIKQDAKSDLTGVVGDVQDNLEAALEAARKLGDKKLVDQIGNTLTFFTRTHVVKEEVQIDVDVDSPDEDDEIGVKLDESMNRMKKLAGLIK